MWQCFHWSQFFHLGSILLRSSAHWCSPGGEKRIALERRPIPILNPAPRFIGVLPNIEIPVDNGSLSSLQLEVFVNAKSTGIQIVPPFRFDISDYKTAIAPITQSHSSGRLSSCKIIYTRAIKIPGHSKGENDPIPAASSNEAAGKAERAMALVDSPIFLQEICVFFQDSPSIS